MKSIEDLYGEYLNGSITDADQQELFMLIEQSDERSLEVLVRKFLNTKVPDDLSYLDEHSEKLLKQIKERIAEPKHDTVQQLWPRIVMAAAAVAAVAFGVWFYNYSNREILKQVQDDVAVNDVAPGKNMATLTLANGKVITLRDAKKGVVIDAGNLTYSDGSVVQYSSGSHFSGSLKGSGPDLHQDVTGPAGVHALRPQEQLTVSTPRGGTYHVRLPDGSNVWLNAASSLTFSGPPGGHGKRVAKLRGEGYFEISKDKVHPFVVITDGQEVEVLGTHFNVNAYEDEAAVKTTLLEGSVAISSLQGAKQSKVIKPGQQAALSASGSIAVEQVNVEDVIDWKEGDFYFENVDFRLVMRKIARWYDVELIYDVSVPQYISSNGVISRNNNLSAVLKLIERSGQVRFKIEGKKVIIIK